VTTPVRQIAGLEAAQRALEEGRARLLLVREDDPDPRLRRLAEAAGGAGVRVRSATARVLERLSASQPAPPVLVLEGRDPDADLAALAAAGGAIWLMTGVAYPGNVGMVVRTAEVSGADGIAIDAPGFDHTARRAALRASMRADRFMPVLWTAAECVLEATAATHRVCALDEAGDLAPWDVDLTGPRVLVVGGENGGIPEAVLRRCQDRIRVPMAGFIPCYNLQAAVSALAVERLRQLGV
jgi:23S rRNA (guanosine2251-2'-O)-methyltransferase